MVKNLDFCGVVSRYGISQEKRSDSTLTLALNSSSLKTRSGNDEPKFVCCPECTRKYEKEALLLQEQEGNVESESPQSCNSSVEVCNKVRSIHEPPQRTDTTSIEPPQPADTSVAAASTKIGANLPLWLQKALPNAPSRGLPSVEVGKVCIYMCI